VGVFFFVCLIEIVSLFFLGCACNQIKLFAFVASDNRFAENSMIVHLQLDIVNFIIVLVVESVFK